MRGEDDQDEKDRVREWRIRKKEMEVKEGEKRLRKEKGER